MSNILFRKVLRVKVDMWLELPCFFDFESDEFLELFLDNFELLLPGWRRSLELELRGLVTAHDRFVPLLFLCN